MPVDIIVIGAGVIGCAVAHTLAESGAQVRIIETRSVGAGASHASAGVLAPYIEGHKSSALRDLGRRSLDLYDDFLQRLASSSDVAVQYDRSGTVEVAFDEEQEARHRQTAAQLAREGIDARWLDPESLRSVEPLAATGARGGLQIALHGFVGVPDLTQALAAAAQRAGATLIPESRVVAVRGGPGGRVAVDVEEEHAGSSFLDSRAAARLLTLTCDRVIVAAGSWTGQIRVEGASPAPVKPIRGQLLHLAWPTTQPLRHVLWSEDCYIVPWQNGRVLVGATVEDAGFDERATAAGVRDLLEAACTLVPHLWQASFAEVRVGLRPASPDSLPIVGWSAVVPGVIYATGHYRNGVLLAPLTAALVRNLVFDRGDDAALHALSPARLGNL